MIQTTDQNIELFKGSFSDHQAIDIKDCAKPLYLIENAEQKHHNYFLEQAFGEFSFAFRGEWESLEKSETPEDERTILSLKDINSFAETDCSSKIFKITCTEPGRFYINNVPSIDSIKDQTKSIYVLKEETTVELPPVGKDYTAYITIENEDHNNPVTLTYNGKTEEIKAGAAIAREFQIVESDEKSESRIFKFNSNGNEVIISFTLNTVEDAFEEI